MFVNLLPSTYIRHLTYRRQAWKWGAAIGVAVVSSAAVIGGQYLVVQSARSNQAKTALQSKDLHQIQTETDRTKRLCQALQSTISTLQAARPEDHTLALLGIASTSARKSAGKIQLKQLSVQISAAGGNVQPISPVAVPGAKPAAPATSSAATSDLLLDGVAEDAAAIANFVESLRGAGAFGRVDLTATSESATATGTMRQFRVVCQF